MPEDCSPRACLLTKLRWVAPQGLSDEALKAADLEMCHPPRFLKPTHPQLRRLLNDFSETIDFRNTSTGPYHNHHQPLATYIGSSEPMFHYIGWL